MGRLRNLGLAALAFLLLGGPGSKVIAEDPDKPKKPKQKLVQVVKKEEEKETPWKHQILLTLEQYTIKPYKNVKNLVLFGDENGVHARAEDDGHKYFFLESKEGISAVVKTKNKIIFLQNRDKKDGFESALSIRSDGTTMPQNSYFKKTKNPDSERNEGIVFEKDIKRILLVDYARDIVSELGNATKNIDLEAYSNILSRICSKEKYCPEIKFKIGIEYVQMISFSIDILSPPRDISKYADDVEKNKDWVPPENLIYEYAAEKGNAIVVFKIFKQENGQRYELFVHNENHKHKGTIISLHPNKQITITKNFARTAEVKDESELINAVVKYTPTENGGVFEHENIDLDSAKELFDFMYSVFQKMHKIYQRNKK